MRDFLICKYLKKQKKENKETLIVRNFYGHDIRQWNHSMKIGSNSTFKFLSKSYQYIELKFAFMIHASEV